MIFLMQSGPPADEPGTIPGEPYRMLVGGLEQLKKHDYTVYSPERIDNTQGAERYPSRANGNSPCASAAFRKIIKVVVITIAGLVLLVGDNRCLLVFCRVVERKLQFGGRLCAFDHRVIM